MSERVFLRGEGGIVTEYDQPLHWAIQKRLEKGYLTRVADAAGAPFEAAEGVGAVPTERPDVADRKSVWVGWAVAESARRGVPISADDAEAATKQDLIERYGTDPIAPAAEQSQPSEPEAQAEAPAPEQ